MADQSFSNKTNELIKVMQELEQKVGQLMPIEEIEKESKINSSELVVMLRELEKENLINMPKEGFVEFKGRPKYIAVELSQPIYEEINEIVQSTKEAFPGKIQSFVEKAIRQYVGNIKYNIEGGVEAITEKDGTLRKSERALTMCISCWRPFLKMRDNKKESGKICPNCRVNIFYFSKLLEQENSDFKRMKELAQISFEGDES
jgi:DNA-directed RNA polymerase subunit RPC12/RpoP